MKRTPMRRRPIDSWKRELDALCRSVTMLRDNFRCCRCGSHERLAWCHVRTRAHLSLRWALDNVLVLCAGCHLAWHHRPLEAVRWWCDKYPDRAKRMMLRDAFRGSRSKLDPEAIRLLLEAERDRLT